jgi:peptide/nickel transport system permease protein
MDKIIAEMTEMYGLEGSVARSVLGVLGAPAARGSGRLLLPVSHPGKPTDRSRRCLGPRAAADDDDPGVGRRQYPGRVCWLLFQQPLVAGLDAVAMVIRPMPYYIFAFALLLIFAYAVRWFPVSGGAKLGPPARVHLALHPEMCCGTRFCLRSHRDPGHGGLVPDHETGRAERKSAKVMCSMRGWRRHGSKIVTRYVFRNALLPQITGLALSLGLIFSGALITEIVFSYPGLGTLLYRAIVNGDYNLIMGITVFSIFAITTSC